MNTHTESYTESAQHCIEMAKEALRKNDREAAWNHTYKICLALTSRRDSFESKAVFVAAVIELSKLGILFGKDLFQITLFLSKAIEDANLIGDRRSGALINLHLGILYYLGQRRVDAMRAFEKGLAEVNARHILYV